MEVPMREMLIATAERALRYLEGLNGRGIAPDPTVVARLAELAICLPAHSSEADETLALLDSYGAATMANFTCLAAARLAEGLRAAGYTILNEVVLNQILVTFENAERTRRVIAGIQQDGTCWCGGTSWQGQTAMRISVSS
jgi:hypothetical protein